MKHRYALYAVEAKKSDYRRMTLLWSGDTYEKGIGMLISMMGANKVGNVELQLIERESTGVLFMRMMVYIDGRPFCLTPEEMGADKYGF